MDEFEPIGQTSEDINIDLYDMTESMSMADVTSCDGFKYPAMLISGVEFKDSLRVLQDIKKDSYKNFDVWVDLKDSNEPVLIGELPADVKTFLAMKYLGLSVILYLDSENTISMDFDDVDLMEKFI